MLNVTGEFQHARDFKGDGNTSERKSAVVRLSRNPRTEPPSGGLRQVAAHR
jgi:hypothetical protein